MGSQRVGDDWLHFTSLHFSDNIVEWVPKTNCCQQLQEEFQLPPGSLWDSPKSVSGSDPFSFQFTASVPGHRACEVFKALWKQTHSYSPSALPYASVTDFQNKMSGSHFSMTGSMDWGALWRTWAPCSLERTSAIVIILLYVSCLPGCVSFDYTESLSLLPFSLWFLLHISACGKSFLTIFRLWYIHSFSVNSCNFGVPLIFFFFSCYIIDYEVCIRWGLICLGLL